MARKFVGSLADKSADSMFSSRIASPPPFEDDSERREHLQQGLFSAPPGHDTRGVLLRFHHYAIGDGCYDPWLEVASVATYLLFLADPVDRHRHGANVVRITPFVFILLLRAVVVTSPRRSTPRLPRGKSDRKYSTSCY